jgi:cellulose 1,4-beta-cellobiosidase
MNYVTQGQYGTNYGGRVYLLANTSATSDYQLFKLINREFAFDVDVSQLECGLNGAVYFV